MTVLLTRTSTIVLGQLIAGGDACAPGQKQDLAVYGECRITSHLGNLKAAFHTLENQKHLIAPGTYPLRLTYSPRFDRYLPEVCDVPHRSGLRFHQGTKPEHSRGCILLSAGNLNRIIQLLTIAQNENEPAYIEIR